MNWKAIGLFGGLAIGAVILLKQFAGKIGYTFQGIKWMGIKGLNIKLALKYKLDNQNDIPATVSKFTGKLLYGDYKLTDVNIDQPITLAPGAAENMEVQFTVKPGMLLAEISKFFEDKAGFSKFKIQGTLTGKVGAVPFAYPLSETLELASS